MDSSQVERKLTAILSADVAGYSRLMGDDHEATLATLTEYRQLFSSIIETHHGRVVNAPGDAILAEFASVVDGVGCGRKSSGSSPNVTPVCLSTVRWCFASASTWTMCWCRRGAYTVTV